MEKNEFPELPWEEPDYHADLERALMAYGVYLNRTENLAANNSRWDVLATVVSGHVVREDAMRGFMRSVAPIFLLLLPGLASCQSADPSRAQEAAVDAVHGPQLNPDSKHFVQIHGRLPEHLDLSLNAEYEATRQGAGCHKQFTLGSLRGQGMQRITDSVDIDRHGEEFDAVLIVDKYLPGQCGWAYQESRAAVWKHTGPDDSSALIVLDGTRYALEENTPRCTPRHRNCSEERLRRLGNHDESIPVVIRCHVDKPKAGEGEEAYFTCGDMFNEGYKIKHLVVPETGHVQINIYDLDVDVDPAPLRN